MLAGIQYHTFISTIYPLNRKSKLDSTFTFILLFVLLFHMASKKVYFFYFLIEKVYFLFYFSKFRKKLETQNFYTNHIGFSQCHTRAIMGISSNSADLKKSRYFRDFEFLKKSNFLELHLALRCVYFAHPEGWNSFCQNRRFRRSKS